MSNFLIYYLGSYEMIFLKNKAICEMKKLMKY